MALMKIGEFAKELGVSVQQLRDMDKNGILKPAAVSPKGTRYYSEEQLYRYTHQNQPHRKVIGYCRVSTNGQKGDLETQISNVRTYMIAKGYSFEVISDIGSGINCKKKGLQKLMKMISNKEVSRVVVLYKDRLMRFGYDMFSYFCELNDTEIEIIDHTETTGEQELTEDLIQIITVFANRLYGKRSKKTKKLIAQVKKRRQSQMKMARKIRLLPTPEQEKLFFKSAGTAR